MKKLLFPAFLIATLISATACTPDPPRNGSDKKLEQTDTKQKVTSTYPNNTVLGILTKENLEKENNSVFSEQTDTGLVFYNVDSDNIIQKIEINFEEQPLNKKLNKIFFLSAIEEQLPSDAVLKETEKKPTDTYLYESKKYDLSYEVIYTVNNNNEVTLIEIEANK